MLNRQKLTADLCVIGGGMAGICAAIAAARQGASVVLMHERPVLGGNASSEIRMWIRGADGKNNMETGIIEEILLENYYRNPTKNYYIWDTVLYDFVIREENIILLLNCTCMDATVSNGDFGDGRTKCITNITGYQMTTQTFFEVESTNYADCSGDSILAPLTGAQYRLGRESADEFMEDTPVKAHDNCVMGMSCLIQARETEQEVKYIPPQWSTPLSDEHFKYHKPELKSPYENFWYLELGGEKDTIHDTEHIAKDLISLATGTWDYVKNSGACDAQNWDLDFLGFLPGKRESRRMVGEYIITQRDIAENKIFEDTVAYGGWPLDVHSPKGFYNDGEVNTVAATPSPYCVPYRSMYSKNISNLFFAGRNISVTHMALSSTRVQATCAIIGQAVGTAAAIASKYNLTPHGVYKNKLIELQQTLTQNDCFLPNIIREVSNLCKKTPIVNGNDTLKNGIDRSNSIYKDMDCGVAVKNGTALEYKFSQPEIVHSLHLTFDSDLNRETLPGDCPDRLYPMRGNVRIDSPQCCVPKTLCKEFSVTVTTENGEKTILEQDCNRNRAYNINIDEPVYSIAFVPKSNWGKTDTTTVFSFDFK